MDGGNSGEDGVSIGEAEQGRDQRMLREKQAKEATEGGYGDEPTERPGDDRKTPVDLQQERHKAGRDKVDAAYHPGQAAQPERSESEGLTGSGPAQAD